jgi:hypothetical protein
MPKIDERVAALEAKLKQWWGRRLAVRAAVKPLRCAVRAPRKPGVAVPGHQFDACVSPPAAAGKT